ncbi:MAG TPA: deoxyribodipyrimidine photo-lyase, partial [Planctomycetaceae bacterium]|nr:deoxyribodipyrimidine photo-lyase [Planctomycetaceae bacterium]
MSGGTIVWFRQDLRLADQPALRAAVARKMPVVPVFVWSPEDERHWPPGAASRWWLHHSLTALAGDLKAHGSRLIVRRGRAADVLPELCDEAGADCVHYCR